MTNYAFALVLSLFSSFVLVGLFSVQRALEDPFVSKYEAIRVSEDLDRLQRTLDEIFAGGANAAGGADAADADSTEVAREAL